MANVVIVADMIRGFCEEGHALYLGQPIRDAIPRIRRLLEEEKARGSTIIFLCDTHDPDDLEFAMFPPHCVRGTEEPEIIPELLRFADEAMPKRRYSGMFETGLEERLRELKPDRVIVTGDCTNICVLYTVADLRARDYVVEVPADCVVTFDPEAHEFALKQMESVLGARVTRTAAAG